MFIKKSTALWNVVGTKFSASVESLGGLFSGSAVFEVPNLQRGTESAERLWEVLAGTFRAVRESAWPVSDAQRLLGSVVLAPSERAASAWAMSVVDGRQSLAAFTLLLCAVRDVLAEDAEADGASSQEDLLVQPMLQNTLIDGSHEGWKLVIDDTDGALLRQIQEHERDGHPTQLARLQDANCGPASPLKDSYAFLHGRVSEALASSFGDDAGGYESARSAGDGSLRKLRLRNAPALLSFVRCAKDYHFVVATEVPDGGAALQALDALSARGRSLTRSDLIKNHILGKVGKNREAMQDELSRRWNDALDKIGPDQGDSEFLLESFISRHQAGGEKASVASLYGLVKKMIPGEDPDACEKYVGELEQDAEFASQLNDPSSYDDEDTRIEIGALGALGAKSARAPILAARRRWGTGEDYRTIVAALVKFFFKFRVVRRQDAADAERVMLEAARMITGGDAPDRILAQIRARDDHVHFMSEFRGEFAKSPTQGAVKYVLQQIAVHLEPRGGVEPADGLALEHILPKDHGLWDPGKFFKGYDGPETDKDDFVARLGNLALPDSPVGTDADSGSGKGASGDARSRLAVGEKTIRDGEWTAAAILEREAAFASFADEIWRL